MGYFDYTSYYICEKNPLDLMLKCSKYSVDAQRDAITSSVRNAEKKENPENL